MTEVAEALGDEALHANRLACGKQRVQPLGAQLGRGSDHGLCLAHAVAAAQSRRLVDDGVEPGVDDGATNRGRVAKIELHWLGSEGAQPVRRLRMVMRAHDVMARCDQLANQGQSDGTGGASDEDAHQEPARWLMRPYRLAMARHYVAEFRTGP